MLLAVMLASMTIGSGPTASPLADIGPAPRTVLVDASGKPFDLASLRGKAVLVSFIYTTCNGTCPGTTQAMTRVRKALDAAGLWGKSSAFVSITMDPAHDSGEVLRQYARLFRADAPDWHFLTGPSEEIRRVMKDWDMWIKPIPGGGFDHPSRVFLVDPRGHIREIYNLEFLTPKAVVKDVQGLVDPGRKDSDS